MRSIRSLVIERLLKRMSNKRSFTDEKYYAAFLKEKQRETIKPYQLPKYIYRKYDIEKQYFGGMECYVYNPGQEWSNKTILYLHGGGYIKQPSFFHWMFIGKIAKKTGLKIIVPIYPKAPNYQYREAFDKVLILYKYIVDLNEDQPIILMGDSAGGGFALALAQLLLEHELRQPQKILLFSPWLDITMSNQEAIKLENKDPMLGIYGLVQMGKSYAGMTDRSHYMLSPINGELKGLGEITLFVGTHEVLLPDARRLRDLAHQQGVKINYFEYPKMNHIFVVYPIPEAKKAMKEIVSEINRS